MTCMSGYGRRMGDRSDVGAALDKLRSTGARITTARRVVLDQLAGAGGRHLTVEEIATAVNTHHPDIHVSTIYRTLEFLTDAGIVVDVRFGGGPVTYHFSGDTHHHAVCEACDRVIELTADVFAPVTRRLAKDHRFEARPRHIVISGLCEQCQQG